MEIFGWEPLVWVTRGVILFALIALTWVGSLYLLRYLRPKNIKQLWGREVGEIDELRALGVAVSLQTRTAVQVEKALHAKAKEINELRDVVEGYGKRLMALEQSSPEIDQEQVEKTRKEGDKSLDNLQKLGEETRKIYADMEEMTAPMAELLQAIEDQLDLPAARENLRDSFKPLSKADWMGGLLDVDLEKRKRGGLLDFDPNEVEDKDTDS